MKNSITKFQTETAESATPETTNAMEVAVTETTTEMSLALPDGIDIASLLAQTELLDKAQVQMSLRSEYLELQTGQTFRGLFVGYGTAKHSSPNEGEGLIEKPCVKLLGSDKKGYINSSVLLVREIQTANLAIGTAIQITNVGEKKMSNGFKAKDYEISLLG